MDIERVNEFTLKFYISYIDIENRGFNREEIWYNRERGEELFWEMMDEANSEESFSFEGPLWIQVQALEKGLEIIVTRAQLSQDGSKLELPITEDKHLDIPVSEGLEQLLNDQLKGEKPTRAAGRHSDDSEELEVLEEDDLSFLMGFEDLEDLIALSHEIIDTRGMDSVLYMYENQYFLNIIFNDERTEHEQDDLLSWILEYGYETEYTIHYVQEYGTEIMATDALAQVRKHFPKK